MNTRRALLVIATLLVGNASLAHAQPETRGEHPVMEWDAGFVIVAGTTIRTRVVFPGDDGPFPLVGVIHGASRNGSYHLELARTLASRGFVAIVPDLPCVVTFCDHDANARQITALLEWAVAQSETPTSRIAGAVDGERRGLIGHSWGGLSSHLTAARDATIDSVVLFDPNDDGTVGRDATATITAPELQLLAEVPGTCNSQWSEAMVTPMLPAPKLQLTVSDSGHCDPEEPGDALCAFGCGAGDPSTSAIFRRYAVAWTACFLAEDASAGEWLGGAMMIGDTRIEAIVSEGLDTLPCRRAATLDAGVELDAGSPTDGGHTNDASAELDGAIARDASSAADASREAPASRGGCGCAVAARGSHRASAVLAVLGIATMLRRRSRRLRRARSLAKNRLAQAQ